MLKKNQKNVKLLKKFLHIKRIYKKFKYIKFFIHKFSSQHRLKSRKKSKKFKYSLTRLKTIFLRYKLKLVSLRKSIFKSRRTLIKLIKYYLKRKPILTVKKDKINQTYSVPLNLNYNDNKHSILEFNKLYNLIQYKLSTYGILINNFFITEEYNKIVVNLEFYFQTKRLKLILENCLKQKSSRFRKYKTIRFLKRKFFYHSKKKWGNRITKNKKIFRGKYLYFYINRRNLVHNKRSKKLKILIKKPTNLISYIKKVIQRSEMFVGKEIILNIKNLNSYANKNEYLINLKRKLDREKGRIFSRNSLLYLDLLKTTYLFLIRKLKPAIILKILTKIFVKLNKRKHNAFLKFITFYFKELISNDVIKRYNKKLRKVVKKDFIGVMQGARLELYGRIGGKTRASSRKVFVGKLRRKSLVKEIYFNKHTAVTPYGTFGIKLWLYPKKKVVLSKSLLKIPNSINYLCLFRKKRNTKNIKKKYLVRK